MEDETEDSEASCVQPLYTGQNQSVVAGLSSRRNAGPSCVQTTEGESGKSFERAVASVEPSCKSLMAISEGGGITRCVQPPHPIMARNSVLKFLWGSLGQEGVHSVSSGA